MLSVFFNILMLYQCYIINVTNWYFSCYNFTSTCHLKFFKSKIILFNVKSILYLALCWALCWLRTTSVAFNCYAILEGQRQILSTSIFPVCTMKTNVFALYYLSVLKFKIKIKYIFDKYKSPMQRHLHNHLWVYVSSMCYFRMSIYVYIYVYVESDRN